eukprot:4658430-Prymnesium_polylepis.1
MSHRTELLLWLCCRCIQRQCPLRHTSARCNTARLLCMWGGYHALSPKGCIQQPLQRPIERPNEHFLRYPARTQAPEELKNLGFFRIMFEKWPDCTALQQTAINAGMMRVSARVAPLAVQHSPTRESEQYFASQTVGGSRRKLLSLGSTKSLNRLPSMLGLLRSASSVGRISRSPDDAPTITSTTSAAIAESSTSV